jgi:thiol-disulfide isomerase/thioredoxin
MLSLPLPALPVARTLSWRRAMLRPALALLALGVTPAALAGSDFVPWTGGATPALTLKDLSGHPVDLADYRGKVVVVNFWATWCAPCIAEMPAMQALRDKLSLAGFEVLAVNFQEGTPRINDFLRKRPLKLTIVRDADGAARTAWGVKVFPTSYVVDTDGRIRYSVQGDADWGSSKVESQIRALLPKA